MRLALAARMHRYRLIEVGCSRELYAIRAEDADERTGDTVARFTVTGDQPQWMQRPMRAFTVTRKQRRVHHRHRSNVSWPS